MEGKYKSHLYVEHIKVPILPAVCVMFGLSHISFNVDRHDRKWILSPLRKKVQRDQIDLSKVTKPSKYRIGTQASRTPHWKEHREWQNSRSRHAYGERYTRMVGDSVK